MSIDVNDLALRAWATVITSAAGFGPEGPRYNNEQQAFAAEFARLVLEEAAKVLEHAGRHGPPPVLWYEESAAIVRKLKP